MVNINFLRSLDILRVDEQGIRTSFGERRAYRPNSSTYRLSSERIVSKMAQYYKNNGNVIGRQIDNKFSGGRGKACVTTRVVLLIEEDDLRINIGNDERISSKKYWKVSKV